MNSYVILFRGVNVSGKSVLPMKALSSSLESNGYQQVKTCIQNCNVVLLSDNKPGINLVNLVKQNVSFIVVLTEAEYKNINQNNSYANIEGKFCYFCDQAPALNLEKLNPKSILISQ